MKEDAMARSYAEGPSLQFPVESPTTLAESLTQAAATDHDLTIVGEGGLESVLSYRDLMTRALIGAGYLRQRGALPGDVVLLALPLGEDFFVAFWASVLAGLIPAPIAGSTMDVRDDASLGRFRSACQLTDGPWVVADLAHCDAIRDEQLTRDGRVVSAPSLGEGTASPIVPRKSDDVALVLFTSGSTGSAKGVKLSHRQLLAMAEGTRQANRFTSKDVTLNWMPIDHVGALSFLHLVPVYLKARQVHALTSWVLGDVVRWLDLLARFHVSISWSANFAFQLILNQLADVWKVERDLSTVRFIANAGEAVAPATVRAFDQALRRFGLRPGAVHPAFGMSETASGISWADDTSIAAIQISDEHPDLGPPIPGARFRIVNDRGEIVPEGQEGLLEISGESVFSGYLGIDPSDTFTADGWFRTGDMGTLRDGRLRITGREKDVLRIRGIDYASIELDRCLAQHPAIDATSTAIVLAPQANGGERLVAFVSAMDARTSAPETAQALRRLLAESVGLVLGAVVFLPRGEFPRSSIGKILRPRLREMLQENAFPDGSRVVDLSPPSASVGAECYSVSFRFDSVSPPSENPPAGTRLGHWLISSADPAWSATLIEEMTRRGGDATEVDWRAPSSKAKGPSRGWNTAIGAPEISANLSGCLLVAPDFAQISPSEREQQVRWAIDALIHAASALAEHAFPQRIRFVLVSRGSVLGARGDGALWGSLWAGFAEVLRVERPDLSVSWMDGDDVEEIVNELERNDPSAVLLRKGQRGEIYLESAAHHSEQAADESPKKAEVAPLPVDHAEIDVLASCVDADKVRENLSLLALDDSLPTLAVAGIVRKVRDDQAGVRSGDFVVAEWRSNSTPSMRIPVRSLDVVRPNATVERTLVRHATGGDRADGASDPLPYHYVERSELVASERWFARHREIGPIVIPNDPAPSETEPPTRFRADATYLITGGAGGVGQALTAFLVERGAGRVIVLGRRSLTPTDSAGLGEMSPRVQYRVCDVTEYAQIAELVRATATSDKPLRGVFHLAVQFRGGLLQDGSADELWEEMAPKALGAWNLHRATMDHDLDSFVLFSSVSALIGSPGVGAYSASNSFLDGLARWRRMYGLPALSLAFGEFRGIGLAQRVGASAEGQRIFAPDPQAAFRLLPTLLRHRIPHALVVESGSLEVSDRDGTSLAAIQASFVADRVGEEPVGKSDWTALSLDQKRAHLQSWLVLTVKRRLGLPQTPKPTDRFVDLGIDSIQSVQLIEEIRRHYRIPVAASVLRRAQTIDALADEVAAGTN